LSVDIVFVSVPLYVIPRGFFMPLWPPFADSVYVGSPFFIDFCGLFTRF
jgi:hypothetical protein